MFGKKEIVVLDLTVEVIWRDVEECLTSVKVEVGTAGLGDGGAPVGVVHIGVEGVVPVLPGLLETIDLTIVVLLAHGHNQCLVSDGLVVLEDDFVGVGVDAIHSVAFGRGVVLAEEGTSGSGEVKFGDPVWEYWYLPCS